MKKQILTVALGFVTVVSFGQKNELKAAEKAIKKQDFATAVSAINSAEPLMANAEKLKSKFYFLKGKAFAGKKEYRTAAAAFNKLLAYEKAANKFKYSDKAAPILNHLIQEVSKKAISFYGKDDFKNATENFYLTYALSPTDTSFLYNAAISSAQAKDLDTSLEYYRKLKEIGYSGIKITYLALNPKTGKEEDLGSKAQRDLLVRSGSYGNPVDKKSKSKSATIIKNIASILSEQGKYEEAVTAIKEARKATPGDINLLLTEADFYIKLKKNG
jgi:tetratricopeptide (TPR) repeat protein